MIEGVFIRTAAKADMAAVSRLLGETWHATYDPIYGPARVAEITRSWHDPAALATSLKRPNAEFVVADDGARLLGMAFAAASAGDVKLVVLHQLYVHPSAQARGIGRALLAEIEDSFPDAARIRLEVEEANARATRFWQRAGFARIGATGETKGAASPAGMATAVYEKRLA